MRERGRERIQCNNIWEQSQDPKHVILTSGPNYPGKNLEFSVSNPEYPGFPELPEMNLNLSRF